MIRRSLIPRPAVLVTTLTATVVTGTGLLSPPPALAVAPAEAAAAASAVEAETSPGRAPAQVIVDWERTSFRTIYTEAATPIPIGVPYLGFTSLAMYDAVRRAQDRSDASAQAAAAVAAHDVLAAYFPGSRSPLDADLTRSLSQLPAGARRAVGVRIGRGAAARMIASRAGDGRDDASIVYDRLPGPGVWAPAPIPGGMLGAWIGFMDRLVTSRPVGVDGPDPLTSDAYARDYREVRRLGSAASTHRTAEQTETALFFNSSSAVQVGAALANRLERHPIGLRRTARLFAAMHAAMTDALINAWRLKYDVGFWRPVEAVAGADADGNPATRPEPGWVPLVTTPPYSEYVSGHAVLTGSAVEVIRQLLGEHTGLRLSSTATLTERFYPRLRGIERQAFHARIWLGLHFRDAMADGYRIAHVTARRVLARLP